MLNTKSMTHRYIFILTALLLAILLLIVGKDSLVFASSGPDKHHYQSDTSIDSAQIFPLLSPAQALSNNKPTVFFFYPVDACRIRYCQQPAQVASKVQENFGDQVNFVAVGINTMTYGPDPLSSPEYALVNWDVYPVAPYADWLPEVIHTATENGLPEARVVLLDADGGMVYLEEEFFSWEEIEPHIVKLLGR